ncbi:MAG: hypothetical protein Q7S52_01650 [bacterium]|nr:hypothetical protein [bacterium]
MKHLGATIFAGLIFLVVAFFSGLLPVSFADVSRGTVAVKHSRETSLVKQGVSQDGNLSVTKVPNAPQIPPSAKMANHGRTLRAFVAPNRAGVLAIYVESVKPHEYYAFSGGFTLTPEYIVLAWTNETTLVFYGTSLDGELMRYTADLKHPTLSAFPISELPPASFPDLQSSGVLP